jgi:hypothetical protein
VIQVAVCVRGRCESRDTEVPIRLVDDRGSSKAEAAVAAASEVPIGLESSARRVDESPGSLQLDYIRWVQTAQPANHLP